MKFYVRGKNPILPMLLKQLVCEAEFVVREQIEAPLDAPFIWQGDGIPDIVGPGIILLPKGAIPQAPFKFFHMPMNPHRLRCAMMDLWKMFSKKTITIGKVTFDPKEHTLQGRNTISLTDKETALLAFLCDRPNVSVNRSDILKSLWGYGETVDTNTLETHIYRVRQKLRQADASCTPLTTREDGYVLAFN